MSLRALLAVLEGPLGLVEDCILVCDVDAKVVLANPAARRLFGNPVPELGGIALALEVIRTALEGRTAAPVEQTFGPATAPWRGRLTASPLRDDTGGVVGAMVVVTAIGGAGLAARFPLFDGMPQLGWVADPDGWIHYYNRSWYEYTGTEPAQMAGWGWESVHDPALLPAVKAEWKACLESGTPYEGSFPLRRHDGVFRWFLTRAIPVRDDAGTIVRWIGINTDIDDQKRAEADAHQARAAAERQREEQHILFTSAPAAIALLRGPELVIEFANPRILEVWGRTPAIIGQPLLEALPEIRGQAFDDLLREVMRTGTPHVGRDAPVNLFRNGAMERVFFSFVYSPIRGAQGEVNGVAAMAFDVTPLVLARERAALGSTVGAAFVSHAPLAEQLRRCCEAILPLGAAFARIWTYRADQDVLELRASAGMYTHTDGAHGRIPVGAFKIGRIARDRKPHLTNAVIGDPQVSDQDWARREGMVSFAGYPLVVGDRVVGVMALFGKHELSPEVLESFAAIADQIALAIDRDSNERFRELFIGMLGHDLRNPLSAITMAASRLAASPALGEPLRPTVQRLERSAQRMARMVAQVLDFTLARSGGGIPIVRAPSDIHAICAQVVGELAESSERQVIDAEYLGDGHGAWDADRLAQVFSNLIGNAVSYGSKDAPIKVLIDARTDDVRCLVHNHGPSIAPAVLPTLFDPFRRATEGKTGASGGLGLGLFISQQIAIAHGAAIAVDSSAERGTSFVVTLPRR